MATHACANMAAVKKRKREVLTLQVKKEIIESLEHGTKPSVLIQEFKNKEKVLSAISTMETAAAAKKARGGRCSNIRRVQSSRLRRY